MKIRIGFVSNSSSSSFVIAVKGKLDEKALQEKILEYFKVPKDSPLYEIAKGMAEVFSTEAKELDDIDEEEQEWIIRENKDLIKEGYTIYTGSISTEGEPYEQMLMNVNIDLKTKDFIIKSNGEF